MFIALISAFVLEIVTFTNSICGQAKTTILATTKKKSWSDMDFYSVEYYDFRYKLNVTDSQNHWRANIEAKLCPAAKEL